MTGITRDRLLEVLARHIGERNGLNVRELVAALDWNEQHNAAAQRAVRELVVALRLEGQHICAHPSSGYYIAENAAELDQTCLFLYDRAMTSLQQVAAMKRISLPDLRGQLHLPT